MKVDKKIISFTLSMWKEINNNDNVPTDPITKNYISMAIEHGTNPNDSNSYKN